MPTFYCQFVRYRRFDRGGGAPGDSSAESPALSRRRLGRDGPVARGAGPQPADSAPARPAAAAPAPGVRCYCLPWRWPSRTWRPARRPTIPVSRCMPSLWLITVSAWATSGSTERCWMKPRLKSNSSSTGCLRVAASRWSPPADLRRPGRTTCIARRPTRAGRSRGSKWWTARRFFRPPSILRAAASPSLAPEVPTKRVVFVGDQQRLNWPAGGADEAVESLPDVQIVQIAPDEPRPNSWVADFRLQDDIADVESPAVFTGVVRYGKARRREERSKSCSRSTACASPRRRSTWSRGKRGRCGFSQQIEAPVESGEPSFIAASCRCGSINCRADDVRYLMVPVVAALPVLFIDNLGAVAEDPATIATARRFICVVCCRRSVPRDDAVRQLVHVRHLAAYQVERQHLEDCRLIVIAGVESPQTLTTLLREYIEQGGQLLIAAGGDFDPLAWTSRAWLDGAGVLPLPLKPEAIGRVPDDTVHRLAAVLSVARQHDRRTHRGGRRLARRSRRSVSHAAVL